MVENKVKKHLTFLAFILPALALYILFFIAPFFNGVGLSFTNWDGITAKIPMTIPKLDYEKKILPAILPKEKEFLSTVYTLSNGQYARVGIQGLKKLRTSRILKKAGYESENYKFIGLSNYKKILTGKAERNFYPHIDTVAKYKVTSSLPYSIPKADFEKVIIKNAKKEAKRLLQDKEVQNAPERRLSTKRSSMKDEPLSVYKASALPPSSYNFRDYSDEEILKIVYIYQEDTETYRINAFYNELEVTRPIRNMGLKASAVSEFIAKVNKSFFSSDPYLMQNLCIEFVNKFNIDNDKESLIVAICVQLKRIAEVKRILEKYYIKKSFNLGVTGFTLFFAIFSVLGINILAFTLALALDTGLRGQKALRAIYFLPNVLSMVIVALIWNILFTHLLPALTGVHTWLMDSKKTPWLLVLIATWQGAGYYMIIYLAGLQNIPSDIIEAASLDGASSLQRFKNITLPLMIPSITVSLFLTIANAFKSFDLMYALLGPTGYATGTVPIVYDIYFQAFSNKQAGEATAKAICLFFVILLITGLQLTVMKKKEIEA